MPPTADEPSTAPGGIPLPRAIAQRPRDRRGYPVPAITPWEDGEPRFAATGTFRTLICAVERRCSICGLVMPPGPVWRVVAGPEAEAIAAARAAGHAYLNRAPTAEAPGHRSCMLFAAMVCPYLARPGARRGTAAEAVGLTAARGDARGTGGAVAGVAGYEFRYDGTVSFRFSGLTGFLGHELGSEHLDELAAELAASRGPMSGPEPIEGFPGYLGADEAAAERRALELWRRRTARDATRDGTVSEGLQREA